jgi:hypothetical protein
MADMPEDHGVAQWRRHHRGGLLTQISHVVLSSAVIVSRIPDGTGEAG